MISQCFRFAKSRIGAGLLLTLALACGGGGGNKQQPPSLPVPTITNVSPTSGPVGTAVSITGTNLDTVTAVTFSGTAAVIGTRSATQLSTTVPSGANTGAISVTGPGGTSISSTNFFVVPNAAPSTPTISGPTSVITLHPATYNLSATDAEGDQITFVISGATPAVPNVGPTSGSGSFNWTATTAGAQTFSVIAQDAGTTRNSSAATFLVNVAANRPPQFLSQPTGQLIGSSNTIAWNNFMVSAQDPDSDDVVFSVGTANFVDNTGASTTGTIAINPTSGAVSFTGNVPAGKTSVTATFGVAATDKLPGGGAILGATATQVVSLTYLLSAQTPPSILVQPVSQTVSAGNAATFSVAATGPGPLYYQWRKNGSTIGGAAASSYTTPATAPADNGSQFSVLVNNAYGSALSNSATLIVNSTGTFYEVEPNDTIASANVVGSTYTTIQGNLFTTGDMDFFALTLGVGKTIRIAMTGPSGVDWDLKLANSAGTVLAFSSGGTANENLSYSNTSGAPMTVYAKVFVFSGTSSTPYNLAITYDNCLSVSFPDSGYLSFASGVSGPPPSPSGGYINPGIYVENTIIVYNSPQSSWNLCPEIRFFAFTNSGTYEYLTKYGYGSGCAYNNQIYNDSGIYQLNGNQLVQTIYCPSNNQFQQGFTSYGYSFDLFSTLTDSSTGIVYPAIINYIYSQPLPIINNSIRNQSDLIRSINTSIFPSNPTGH